MCVGHIACSAAEIGKKQLIPNFDDARNLLFAIYLKHAKSCRVYIKWQPKVFFDVHGIGEYNPLQANAYQYRKGQIKRTSYTWKRPDDRY